MKIKTPSALRAAWLAVCLASPMVRAQVGTNNPATPVLPDKPVSLVEAVNLAAAQNGTLVKARKDLEASAGIVFQTKAILVPKLQVKGGYQIQEKTSVDSVPLPAPYSFSLPNQSWNVGIQLVQSVYEGGRLSSALRTARLTKEQAVAQYETVLNDTLLTVRTSYYDVLLAEKQIAVEEASVDLLKNELKDATERFKAGTVPSFNVLRAKVELANEQPKLIKARIGYRTAKNNLASLMGFHLPAETREDIPLRLDGKLEAEPFDIELQALIQEALANRPELTALRKTEMLRREDIVGAKAGRLPSMQIFGGYADRNSQFESDISRDLPGWQAGVQVSWNIFDGFLTKGKVAQATALRDRATADLDDQARRVELDARTAYSSLVEAREVLESQQKVVEEAVESLRLATARNQAGTGTQLDVLSSQTALTQARMTEVQATHDYLTAVAGVERSAGRVLRKKP